MLHESLKVGDTVRPIRGGPLMEVEGFEPLEVQGKTDKRGLVKCVVIYTDNREDSEKERNKIPRLFLDKWRRKARKAA